VGGYVGSSLSDQVDRLVRECVAVVARQMGFIVVFVLSVSADG
jgi:hypothetical protein